MNSTIGTDILMAIRFLEQGKLVAIPTETVYGLAANGLRNDAVLAIYEAKNRPQFNPLILHFANPGQLAKFGLQLPEQAAALASKFSPGALTYVIPASDAIPDLVTAGTGAVAVRFPAHPVTQALLRQLDFPLAAPSANPSGYVSPTTSQHVAEQLGDKVAYILEGGASEIGLESTIVSFLEDQPRLLRHGGISLEEIEGVVGKLGLPQKGYVDNPVAPGMLARHYATKHPIQIGDLQQLTAAALTSFRPTDLVVIGFNEAVDSIPATHQFILSPTGNLREAAQRLFAALRLADAMDVQLILAANFPEQGLGRAINDRLQRAATPQKIDTSN